MNVMMQPRQQGNNITSSFTDSINSFFNRFRIGNSNYSNEPEDIQCLSKSVTKVNFIQLLVHVKRSSSSILIDNTKKTASFIMDSLVPSIMTISIDRKVIRKEEIPPGFDQTITFENKKLKSFEIKLEVINKGKRDNIDEEKMLECYSSPKITITTANFPPPPNPSSSSTSNISLNANPILSSNIIFSNDPINSNITEGNDTDTESNIKKCGYEETRVNIENLNTIIESQRIKIDNQYMSLLEIYGQPTLYMKRERIENEIERKEIKNKSGKYSNYHIKDERMERDNNAITTTITIVNMEEGESSQMSVETPKSTTSSNQECVICLANIRNIVMLSCRHMCICEECVGDASSRIDKCPICRQTYDSLLKIDYDIKNLNN